MFSGPILAAFLLGVLTRKADARGVKIGVLSGVMCNVVLWVWFPGVEWMWWNATGAVASRAVDYLFRVPGKPSRVLPYLYLSNTYFADANRWISRYVLLAVCFLLWWCRGLIAFYRAE